MKRILEVCGLFAAGALIALLLPSFARWVSPPAPKGVHAAPIIIQITYRRYSPQFSARLPLTTSIVEVPEPYAADFVKAAKDLDMTPSSLVRFRREAIAIKERLDHPR